MEVGELCCFLALNSSLRLAFLLSVEGLGFFLVLGALLLVVSKEKEKVGPTEREKLKTWPWLASAWQKSMHLEAREEFTSSTAVILCLLLNYEVSKVEEEHAFFHSVMIDDTVMIPLEDFTDEDADGDDDDDDVMKFI